YPPDTSQVNRHNIKVEYTTNIRSNNESSLLSEVLGTVNIDR
ncbi:7578_t:CDS:2, partial [Dentiscutata heterogama]